MGTYIAVTLKQPRKYRFWLGRKCLDGSVALIAEFANEHTLGVVVLKLNDEPIPRQVMDPEQPDKIDFHHPSVVTGEAFRSHPDSVRAHNARWPNDQRDPETSKKSIPEADGAPVQRPPGT